MSMITINGTTFEGASVLQAVERVAPLPGGGEGMVWYPHQLVSPEAYAERLRLINSPGWAGLDLCESQPLPYLPAWEVVRGGWNFLYWVDTRGNGNSMCFTVCGGNAATEKGGAGNG